MDLIQIYYSLLAFLKVYEEKENSPVYIFLFFSTFLSLLLLPGKLTL